MTIKPRWIILLILVAFILSGCIPDNLPGGSLSQEDVVATQVEATLQAHQAANSVAETVAAQTGGDSSQPPPSGGDSNPPPATQPPPTEPPAPLPTPTLDLPMVFVTTPTNCRTGPGLEKYKKIGGLMLDEETEVVGLPETEMDFAIVNNPDDVGTCWLYLGFANMSYAFLKENYPHLALYATPAPDLGSIAGKVWNDHCSVAGGSPPPGCKDTPAPYEANGILDGGETGFAGVLVELGAGACPSTGHASTNTNANGNYSFANLPAGDYCVSVNSLNGTNTPS